MITVYSEEDLKAALQEGKEDKILAKGDFAEKIMREYEEKSKAKKMKRVAAGVAVVSAIAIPFTGGLSFIGVGAALTLGTITITTTELAIVVGGFLCYKAMSQGYTHIKLTKNSIEFSK